ncbi:MAG: dipeptide ABC transporter ATP-binding protein, partial [Rhodospirillaceae bacterium]
RVMAMFAKVGFPDPKRALSLYPFELSGGLRQRAMIAMALICGPALLIADEPTTALDVTVQAQILKLMRDLQAEFNMAILLITHDLGVVANMADEVAVVYHGRLMESGPADALFQNPKHPYLQALFGALPTLDDDPERRLTPVREIPLIDTPLLNKADGSAGGAPAACEGPLLSVKALEKSFTTRKGGGLFRKAKHSHPAVIDVSFDVMQGDSLGLVGESGSGKTTVSRLISRLLMPDRGQILFAQPGGGPAADLASLSQTEVRPFRRRIQYVFQDPTSALDPRMTVFGLLSEPMEIQEVGDRAYRAETAKELMRLVGLDQRWLGRYANSFSGGQRQRIGIARALALRPELLLLDEPVSALDVSVQAQILNLLKDLRGALGLTYLFVSHNLAVVRYLCDTIAVMCAGRIVEYGPTDALFADARHPYTQALLTAVPHIRLDHPLDFEAVARGRASVPAEWPAPFGFPQGSVAPGIRVDCGNGHWVLQGPESAEVGTTTEPGEAA